MPIDPPTCRATIRGDQVTLNGWFPRLGSTGPEPRGFATIDAALADLQFDDDEVVVTPVPRTPWSASAEQALLRWAPLAGYRRVWLPGRVVDLADVLAPLAVARVRCPTCGATWEDGGIPFWQDVRERGWFPARCLACGGSLPEWSVSADTSDLQVSDRDAQQRLPERGETHG